MLDKKLIMTSLIILKKIYKTYGPGSIIIKRAWWIGLGKGNLLAAAFGLYNEMSYEDSIRAICHLGNDIAFIDKYKGEYVKDICRAACRGFNKIIIDKLSKSLPEKYINVYILGFKDICMYGTVEQFKILLAQPAYSTGQYLKYAVKGGNYPVIKYIIKNRVVSFYFEPIRFVFQSQKMYNFYAKHFNIHASNFDYLFGQHIYGKIEPIDEIPIEFLNLKYSYLGQLDNLKENNIYNLTDCIYYAIKGCSSGSLEVYKYLTELGGILTIDLPMALKYKNHAIVDYIISQRPLNKTHEYYIYYYEYQRLYKYCNYKSLKDKLSYWNSSGLMRIKPCQINYYAAMPYYREQIKGLINTNPLISCQFFEADLIETYFWKYPFVFVMNAHLYKNKTMIDYYRLQNYKNDMARAIAAYRIRDLVKFNKLVNQLITPEQIGHELCYHNDIDAFNMFCKEHLKNNNMPQCFYKAGIKYNTRMLNIFTNENIHGPYLYYYIGLHMSGIFSPFIEKFHTFSNEEIMIVVKACSSIGYMFPFISQQRPQLTEQLRELAIKYGFSKIAEKI